MHIEQVVEIYLNFVVRMMMMMNRIFAIAIALKWHCHVLRGMQHLTCPTQSKMGQKHRRSKGGSRNIVE